MTDTVTYDQALRAGHRANDLGNDLHMIFWLLESLERADQAHLLEYRMKEVHTGFQAIASILGYSIRSGPLEGMDTD